MTGRMGALGSRRAGDAQMGIDRLLLPASAGVAMRVVGHSMGGLITMRELISHPESRRKVPLLVFYATQ